MNDPISRWAASIPLSAAKSTAGMLALNHRNLWYPQKLFTDFCGIAAGTRDLRRQGLCQIGRSGRLAANPPVAYAEHR